MTELQTIGIRFQIFKTLWGQLDVLQKTRGDQTAFFFFWLYGVFLFYHGMWTSSNYFIAQVARC